ncbi:hypothetical protein EYF80_043450 [Liparis tanakae]|uniref:Uncharacterized protein n=1 Tax=Liparis tanakae TaxID=230148 RepID=A0A4Z2G1G3_9TELE|nr:hypothetical protein EYF80_043450 [Liparis tanakae]
MALRVVGGARTGDVCCSSQLSRSAPPERRTEREQRRLKALRSDWLHPDGPPPSSSGPGVPFKGVRLWVTTSPVELQRAGAVPKMDFLLFPRSFALPEPAGDSISGPWKQ